MISLAQVFRPADEDAEAADEVRIERANANARERADATMEMRPRASSARGRLTRVRAPVGDVNATADSLRGEKVPD